MKFASLLSHLSFPSFATWHSLPILKSLIIRSYPRVAVLVDIALDESLFLLKLDGVIDHLFRSDFICCHSPVVRGFMVSSCHCGVVFRLLLGFTPQRLSFPFWRPCLPLSYTLFL